MLVVRGLFSPWTRSRTAGRLQVVYRGLTNSIKSARPCFTLSLANFPNSLTKGRRFAAVAHLSTGSTRDHSFALAQSEISAVEERITLVENQILDVAASLKVVEEQIPDVGSKIENIMKDLKQKNLLQDDKEILKLELMRLIDKESRLLDEKKALLAEKKIQDEAMGAMYIQQHDKFTRHGHTVMRTGPGASQSCELKFVPGQDFSYVRMTESSYTVDKSAFISKFLEMRRVVFRRPRRYGKTLFLSMLKYFFYGATSLFKGMAIYEQTIDDCGRFVWCPHDSSRHNWPPYPVLHLDFSSLASCTTAEEFSVKLVEQLAVVGKANKCNIDLSKSPREALRDLVIGLSNQPMNKRKEVVVLIDEYDTPLNERASDVVFQGILGEYKKFFTELKALDQYISFAYVTGITSYAMAGIHSGANNFLDLTHYPNFESMCAFTEEEFKAAVSATRPQESPMSADTIAAIKVQYNGYSWDLEQRKKGERRTLFNPFFVAMYCKTGKLDDYWGQTTSVSLVAKFPAIVSIDIDAQSTSVIKRSVLKKPWFPSDNSPQDCVRHLFEAGYFTVVDVIDDAPASTASFAATLDADVKLGIPNQQILKLFKSDYLSSSPSEFSPVARVSSWQHRASER